MLCINWAEICKDKINLNYNLIGSSWNDNFCCLLAKIVYENLCVHGKCAIFVLTFLFLFCYLDMLIEIKKKDRCIRPFFSLECTVQPESCERHRAIVCFTTSPYLCTVRVHFKDTISQDIGKMAKKYSYVNYIYVQSLCKGWIERSWPTSSC